VISSLFSLIFIAATITLLMLLGEILHWLFASKTTKKVRLSHALDELFLQSGTLRYLSRHVERLILLHFIAFMLGILSLLLSIEFDVPFNLGILPLTAAAAWSFGVWWAWRRGVLK
jgi:hypothetical protein